MSSESTDIFMRTRRVDVEGHLNSMRGVSTTRNDPVTIEYRYLVRCDQMYYGSACSRYCEDTDDATGHFTCDGDGNPVCLPGYNHSSTNDNRCTQCIENCTATITTSTEEIILTEGKNTSASMPTFYPLI